MARPSSTILTINSGSSSIKFALYRLGDSEELLVSGKLDRIGLEHGKFTLELPDGSSDTDKEVALPDHDQAFRTLFDWLENHEVTRELAAIGHRLVHGGPSHVKTQKINPAAMEDLQKLIPLAPEHLPHEIKGIEAAERIFPKLPQVACFDTAFHRRMPEVAQRFALPEDLYRDGVLRYGFHGLSYEYILLELTREAGEAAAQDRVIIAHLGNGASMAATEAGQSRDTTMGMTPTGGLVMSTRSGDLDPGVLLFLLKERGMTADAVHELVNQRAGLLGVSGRTSDMQDLLRLEKSDPSAALAVELFCYQARKFLGALTAALGGLATLVFTGGIGENSPVIRERICRPLGFLGIRLEETANRESRPVISAANAPVTVRVIPTNEELMIARHTYDLLSR